MPELAAHLERAKELAEQVGAAHKWHSSPCPGCEKNIAVLAAALAACAREARNEALEQAAHICDFAADGTTEKMSEDGHSEEWKVIAENSVEQYHSMARNIRRLRERAVGEKGS